jgi:RNA polymerase sigma-70 factor, ECF subfamily
MQDDANEILNRNKQFFEFYGRCQYRILSFLFMMVHNETDAEDLLQDTAATMLEKFNQYEQGTNFTAWGMMVAKNKAINFLNKNAKTRPQFRADFYERITEIETKESESYSERAAAMKKCLEKVQDADKKILQMRYEHDCSMKKIADILGRSKTGIYHTLARIHNILNDCIKAQMAGQI